ncbi:MAG: hypothetical protein HYZ42_00900, partial [Bacteroidetes bacterium]|nr:hypothetical protein [Bacteroidota bacterium]
MKHILKLLFVIVALKCNNSTAQSNNCNSCIRKTVNTTKSKLFGGSADEGFNKIIKTADGGYLSVGYTRSSVSGNVTGTNQGAEDFWIMKTDANLNYTWDKVYGGSGTEMATDARQLIDGSYIVVGYTTSSSSGNVGANAGDMDYWVLKLTATGVISWQQTIGYGDKDMANGVELTDDGGFIVVGYSTYCNNYPVNNDAYHHGARDIYAVKLSSSGSTVWEQFYGSSENDEGAKIAKITNYSFAISGTSQSNNNMHTYLNTSYYNYEYYNTQDMWVGKIDRDGSLIWSITEGGDADDVATGISWDGADKLVVTGNSNISYETNPYEINSYIDDKMSYLNFGIRYMKLDTTNGSISWSQMNYCFESATDIVSILGSRIAVAAFRNIANSNIDDSYILYLSNNGLVEEYNQVGGSDYDAGNSIVVEADSSLTVAGTSFSHDGDLSLYSTNNTYGAWIYQSKKSKVSFDGTVSNVWTNPANWSNGSVPLSYDDVVINADCELGANRGCYNLYVSAGKTIKTVPGGFLKINGVFTLVGSLDMNAGGIVGLGSGGIIPVAVYTNLHLMSYQCEPFILNNNITVKDLRVYSAVVVSTENNLLKVTGNIQNDGFILTPGGKTGRVLLQNTTGFTHTLTGANPNGLGSCYGDIELNSPGGARALVPLNIQSDLILTDGVFNYGVNATRAFVGFYHFGTTSLTGVIYSNKTSGNIYTTNGSLLGSDPNSHLYFRSNGVTNNFKSIARGHITLEGITRVILGSDMLVEGTLSVFGFNPYIHKLDLNGYKLTVMARNNSYTSGMVACNNSRMTTLNPVVSGGNGIGHITNTQSNGGLYLTVANFSFVSFKIDSLLLDTMVNFNVNRGKSKVILGKDWNLNGQAQLYSAVDLGGKVLDLGTTGVLQEQLGGAGAVFYGNGSVKRTATYSTAMNANIGSIGLNIISTNAPNDITIERKHNIIVDAVTGNTSLRRNFYVTSTNSAFNITGLRFIYDPLEQIAGNNQNALRLNNYDFTNSVWGTIVGGTNGSTGNYRWLNRVGLSLSNSVFHFTLSDSINSPLIPVFTDQEGMEKDQMVAWP